MKRVYDVMIMQHQFFGVMIIFIMVVVLGRGMGVGI